jgi:hypothetical protein
MIATRPEVVTLSSLGAAGPTTVNRRTFLDRAALGVAATSLSGLACTKAGWTAPPAQAGAPTPAPDGAARCAPSASSPERIDRPGRPGARFSVL